MNPDDYWFPWHPTLYADHAIGLTLEQDAIYRRLIDKYMLRREPLPNTPQSLANICNITVEKWAENSSAILPFFFVQKGLLNHDRCNRELDLQDMRSKKRSEKAQRAAKKRWNKNSEIDATSMPQAMLGDARGQDRTIERASDMLGNLLFFEEFWLAYPKKTKKGFARKAYERAVQRIPHAELMDGLRRHKFPPETRFAPQPADWLDGDCWLDQTPHLAGFGNEMDQWKTRIQGWKKEKFWLQKWGDNPDSQHCLCPREIIEAA